MNLFYRATFAACDLIKRVSPCRLPSNSVQQLQALSTISASRTSQSSNTTGPQITGPSTAIISRLLGNQSIHVQQARTRIYQSWEDAQPVTVAEVPQRFKRLGNGLWIRPRAGRRKALWKRKPETLERLKEHVICTKRQCWMLERMVGKFYKRHHHYPNDPYAPYHVRNGFPNDKVYKNNRAPFYP